MMRRPCQVETSSKAGFGLRIFFVFKLQREMVSSINKKNTRLSRMKKTMKEEWVELTDGKRKIIMPRREMVIWRGALRYWHCENN